MPAFPKLQGLPHTDMSGSIITTRSGRLSFVAIREAKSFSLTSMLKDLLR
jgi:hypothetical protein